MLKKWFNREMLPVWCIINLCVANFCWWVNDALEDGVSGLLIIVGVLLVLDFILAGTLVYLNKDKEKKDI